MYRRQSMIVFGWMHGERMPLFYLNATSEKKVLHVTTCIPSFKSRRPCRQYWSSRELPTTCTLDIMMHDREATSATQEANDWKRKG